MQKSYQSDFSNNLNNISQGSMRSHMRNYYTGVNGEQGALALLNGSNYHSR